MGSVHAKAAPRIDVDRKDDASNEGGDAGDSGAALELSSTVEKKAAAAGDGGGGSRTVAVKASDVAVQVERVHVDGVQRTHDDVMCCTQMQSVLRSTNLQELILQSLMARDYFNQLGIFKKISIFIDTSKGPEASPDGVEVTFNVREFKPIGGGVSTTVGNNEANMVVGVRMPNVTGRAEKLSAEFSRGMKKTQGFHFSFMKPILSLSTANAKWTSSVFQQYSEYPWSSYNQVDQGFYTQLAFNTWPSLEQTLRWEVVWRELGCLNRTAPFDVRRDCGHTLTSAIKHIVQLDRRDNPLLPNSGTLLKMTNECAGLVLGDVAHLKSEVTGQVNMPLPLECSVQATANLAHVLPFDSGQPVLVADRFFLGGPLSLRGFEHRGAGPMSDGASTGGNTRWNVGLHVYTPLPFRPGRGGLGDLFRLHGFLNSGAVFNTDLRQVDREHVEKMFKDSRWSCGVGLMFLLGGVARLELNYCLPGNVQKHDKAVKGLQFGVGIEFV